MRYMMLVYTREDAQMSEAEMAAVAHTHEELMKEASQRGILHGAEPLASTSNAFTVRHQDGKVMVTDGPFAETKEQLAGYYILDCKTRDEAIEWASKIPTQCGGAQGSIEIRPFRFPASESQA
ncbi:MAG TPA: YciI family protein [Pyrinomonadaceae bacterium]|nr:YciI family protein [Pyrinomonadaceae bacterium]